MNLAQIVPLPNLFAKQGEQSSAYLPRCGLCVFALLGIAQASTIDVKIFVARLPLSISTNPSSDVAKYDFKNMSATPSGENIGCLP